MSMARPATLLSGLILGACFGVHASEAATPAQPEANQAVADVDAGNEVMVGINPRTGKLRQLSSAEVKALQTKAAAMQTNRTLVNGAVSKAPRTAAEARLTMRKQATGGVAVRVPLSAMSTMTVTQDEEGRLNFSESDAPQAPAKAEVME